ncbi:hypothetical protein COW95_02140 [Candidatus Peregrinibacteria bacterium CG22_combo_CG10-13_8_21_14_all_49_11]|nr:MAG: hypothetical protein COW95_02140 [Candidatus Peregrinibacteria bacterium CG22_combo_CG10-13_8_21_14_all_49_11]
MTTPLFSISLAALLSTASLLTILFRVSPLSAPVQAIPAFFISLFLSLSTVMTLLAFACWTHMPFLHSTEHKQLSTALREGTLFAVCVSILLVLHLVGVLSIWVALLTVAVFVLVELAMLS